MSSVEFEQGSETFVQPQVCPPLWSYQISEPLMSILMGNNGGDVATVNEC